MERVRAVKYRLCLRARVHMTRFLLLIPMLPKTLIQHHQGLKKHQISVSTTRHPYPASRPTDTPKLYIKLFSLRESCKWRPAFAGPAIFYFCSCVSLLYGRSDIDIPVDRAQNLLSTGTLLTALSSTAGLGTSPDSSNDRRS